MTKKSQESQVERVVTDVVYGVKTKEDAKLIAKRALAVMHESLNGAYAKNKALLEQTEKMTKVVAELNSVNLALKNNEGFGLKASLVKEISKKMDGVYKDLHQQQADLRKGLQAGAAVPKVRRSR